MPLNYCLTTVLSVWVLFSFFAPEDLVELHPSVEQWVGIYFQRHYKQRADMKFCYSKLT